MNYTIIGDNGKNYGPAGADQLRQWIKEGRVDSRTPVFAEGAADWTILGLLPEFAPEFPGHPPVITVPKAGAAGPARTSQLAIWGFVCGMLGWTFCGCCAPAAIVGLVLSIVALVEINARPEGLGGRGFAIAGIVISATSLLWSLGMAVLGLLNNSQQMQWNLGN
jgi:hypothetical protein